MVETTWTTSDLYTFYLLLYTYFFILYTGSISDMDDLRRARIDAAAVHALPPPPLLYTFYFVLHGRCSCCLARRGF